VLANLVAILPRSGERSYVKTHSSGRYQPVLDSRWNLRNYSAVRGLNVGFLF
jgi:hypothetical protein